MRANQVCWGVGGIVDVQVSHHLPLDVYNHLCLEFKTNGKELPGLNAAGLIGNRKAGINIKPRGIQGQSVLFACFDYVTGSQMKPCVFWKAGWLETAN